MSLEEDLERIINSPGTKSDRARALFRLGCERTDVVELLGMNYSQAHSVWKGMQDGQAAAVPRGVHKKAAGGEWSPTYPATATGAVATRLNLRPAQTRYITQDGHVVLKDFDGRTCLNCGEPIDFFLKWLGFLHLNSKSEPTKLEDRYDEALA